MISIGQQEVSKLQVAQEMLFVWPESGAMAALEAASKEPVLSPHMTKQVHMHSLTLLLTSQSEPATTVVPSLCGSPLTADR